MNAIIGIIVALGLFIGYPVSMYNDLVAQRAEVAGQAANVDAMLQRRADLIPNLVETVKGYTKHESDVLTAVTKSREALLSAGNIQARNEADIALSASLGRLIAISESYPELKANKVYNSLIDELAGSENRIAVARTQYNGVVTQYNTAIQQFPKSAIANFGGFLPAELLKVDPKAKEVPKVKF